MGRHPVGLASLGRHPVGLASLGRHPVGLELVSRRTFVRILACIPAPAHYPPTCARLHAHPQAPAELERAYRDGLRESPPEMQVKQQERYYRRWVRLRMQSSRSRGPKILGQSTHDETGGYHAYRFIPGSDSRATGFPGG